MWGLLLDRAVAETIVISNGSIVTASEDENADLFWVRYTKESSSQS